MPITLPDAPSLVLKTVRKKRNLIQSKLIYGEYFYAAQWQLPEVFTDIVDFRIDPTWHEFESVAYTDAAADAGISLAGFMEVVRRNENNG